MDHGCIFLTFISLILVFSIFCKLRCFHRKWPQLATILRSFDLSVDTKSKSLTFDLKQAIHGEKNLSCKK